MIGEEAPAEAMTTAMCAAGCSSARSTLCALVVVCAKSVGDVHG